MNGNDDRLIGIIGGKGAMGGWFENFFKNAGYPVLISDIDTPISNEDLAVLADVLIISVPINQAIKVVESISPILMERQLLIDLCSLKQDIVEFMLESTCTEVVGMHPLFGPLTQSIAGQNIILCPGRSSDGLDWISRLLQTCGANVQLMDAVTHDRNMAIFQGLIHILSVSLCYTLRELKIKPIEVMEYSPPIFRINLDLMGRLFAQDSQLYGNLIGENRHVKEIMDVFSNNMKTSVKQLLSEDFDERIEFLEEIKTFLGDFPKQALQESNNFINILSSKQSDEEDNSYWDDDPRR